MNERALVVFSDDTDICALKILKRGFRHCFVCIEKNGLWLSLDPLAHKTELLVIDVPDGFNLADWLRGEGCTVIETHINPHIIKRPLWPAFASCVESVKRVLGLRKPFILTPWQLFNTLNDRERN